MSSYELCLIHKKGLISIALFSWVQSKINIFTILHQSELIAKCLYQKNQIICLHRIFNNLAFEYKWQEIPWTHNSWNPNNTWRISERKNNLSRVWSRTGHVWTVIREWSVCRMHSTAALWSRGQEVAGGGSCTQQEVRTKSANSHADVTRAALLTLSHPLSWCSSFPECLGQEAINRKMARRTESVSPTVQ